MKLLNVEFEKLPLKGNSADRLYGSVGAEELRGVIERFKESGYNHLVAISCVDWIDKGEFELIYHLWSYSERVDVLLSVRIGRDEPKMESIKDIFLHAETYEREIHEMFGVSFEGNDRLNEFILEDWEGPPPMRKDFNTEAYANEHFYSVPLVEDEE